jgi:putative SOS response-associated peptidase YedK
MSRFYEPDWCTGKAVRTAIAMADGRDFAVAGIWAWWRDPETDLGRATFSMLTINADEHPVVIRNLHRPGDEKRSLVIVPEEDWDSWLGAPPELARAMLTLYPAELLRTEPAPVPPRPKKMAREIQ